MIDIREAAIEAFNTADMIIGTISGGIEAPRIVLDAVKDGDSVKIIYTYHETCGLSDCRYHDTRAGYEYEDVYTFEDNRVLLNGETDIFHAEYFKYDALVQEQINNFRVKYPLLEVA